MTEHSRKPDVESRRIVLLMIVAALAVSGCKRKENEAEKSAPVTTVDTAEITALRNALTQGMTAMAFDKLTQAHLGRRCVVTARTPDRADPPPPPLGMVHRMGSTTIYAGELHEALPDSLKIRAAYPTSGNLKIIEIPRPDIQSIHMGG